jgi:uncharacterized protein YecE (DUF72 family)
VLWQLPPTLGFDEQRLTTFFEALPRTSSAAAVVAGRHDERLEGRALTSATVDVPLRHAMEVRHASFTNDRFLALLRAHDVAVVVADSAGRYPAIDAVTSDFAYARLHGADELYVSGYTPDALDLWAERVRRWTDDGVDAFVYFDNDAKVRAPFDAMGLIERLG